MELEKLTVKIGADVGEFVKGVDKATGKSESLKEKLAKIGGASTVSAIANTATAITTMGTAFMGVAGQAADFAQQVVDETVGITVSYANEVRKMQQLTGQTAGESSRLIQIMDDWKVSTEDLTMATKKLSEKGLTLSVETLAQLSDEYKKLNTGAEKAKFLTDNFGKSGLNMAEAMEQGGDAIRANADALDGNLVLTEENVKAAREYEAQLDSLNDSVDALKIGIGRELLPVLNNLLKGLNTQAEMTGKSRNEIISYIKAMKDVETSNESATRSYTAYAKSVEEKSGSIVLSVESVTKAHQDNLSIMEQLTGASDEQTARIVYNNLLQKLSVDGITDAEAKMLTEAGIALGVIDATAPNTALNISKISQAFLDGKINAYQLGYEIRNLPKEGNFTWNFDAVISPLLAQYIETGESLRDKYKYGGGKATGGPVSGNTAYLVGERGPELFLPGSNGNIIPNNKIGAASPNTGNDALLQAIKESRIDYYLLAKAVRDSMLQAGG